MKFNRFTDVTTKPLQVYNRAVMFHNIFEDHGEVSAKEYAASFTQEERLMMAQMTALVRSKGVKYVQKLVTDGVSFVDYASEEDAI